MGKVTPATHYISEDEPCFLLTELDSMPPKGKPHRYRNFYVMRGDRIHLYVEDMGLSKKHKAPECRIPGGVIDPTSKRIFIEHSVAQLRAIAQDLKKSKWDVLELAGVNRVRNP